MPRTGPPSALGAATDLMDQAWWSPGLTHPDGRSTFSLWFTGGIFVDSDGRRFVNESGPYDRLGRTVVDRIDSGAMTLPFWMIYDDREGEVPPVKSTSVSLVATERYRDAGLWHTADTLEELAAIIGVPPAHLVATVSRFNELATDGVDRDFGRGDEAYDRSVHRWRVAPGSPRSAAVPRRRVRAVRPRHQGRAAHRHRRPRARRATAARYPGLYAAGNTMAAVSGTAYPGGGNPIGASMLFSHLAALHMAGRPTPR